MHLLLTDVAPSGPNCRAALAQLRLPTLTALLRLLPASQHQHGNRQSLSPLSEQVYAQALDLDLHPNRSLAPDAPDATDGLLPWAALDAQRLQLPAAAANQGWGWITPCHWNIRTNHVHMDDPTALALQAHESDALRSAMASYFAEDGLTLHACRNSTWLACGTLLHQLPTASLARVSGHPVDPWMGHSAQARTLRRLQNEMQMLLYTHPVNVARAAQGLPAVNSFWISGTGNQPSSASALSCVPAPPSVTLEDKLRTAAANDDAQAWCAAWNALESGALAALLQRAIRGEPVQLTLCGDDCALHFTRGTPTAWQRLRAHWRTPNANTVLETLCK